MKPVNNNSNLLDSLSPSKAGKGWIQPSIDQSYIPISNEKIINGVYAATADEQIIEINETNQSWFFTDAWQTAEKAVQADIDAGKVHRFSSVEDAIAALGLEEDAGD